MAESYEYVDLHSDAQFLGTPQSTGDTMAGLETKTKDFEIQPNHPAYPPGGIMIWMILSVELLTFIPALIMFMAERQANLELFQASAAKLDAWSGTINTIALLTSGWLMAASITALRKQKQSHALKFLGGAIGFGILFLFIKSMEYSGKLDAGLNLRYNTFFTFYWLLTGFHFLHVLLGVLLLSFMWYRLKKQYYSSGNYYDIETSAVFWHMCDLIWVLLFPIFYLLA